MTQDRITIKREDRQTLALKVEPAGIVVHIPRHLDPDSRRVQTFIDAGLAKLPDPGPPAEPRTRDDVHSLVAAWAERLDVQVDRLQIRQMRTKWASCSTAGTLTLADDILHLPQDLVDYIICHELLHIKLPNHRKGFQAMLGAHMPDWPERELRLASWIVRTGQKRL